MSSFRHLYTGNKQPGGVITSTKALQLNNRQKGGCRGVCLWQIVQEESTHIAAHDKVHLFLGEARMKQAVGDLDELRRIKWGNHRAIEVAAQAHMLHAHKLPGQATLMMKRTPWKARTSREKRT